jgi:DNA-binding Xre family transcriptional regulator
MWNDLEFRLMRARRRVQLDDHKIVELNQLAKLVDRDEAKSIRERGQVAFAHHARLRSVVDDLRAVRIRKKLSLAEVSRRSGIAKSNLSRLENSRHISPSLESLDRYARAVGKTIQIGITSARAA